MSAIKDYLVFLVYFTAIIIIGSIILFSIGYLAGSFIKWEWIEFPPMNTWRMTMEDLRIAVVGYFITSICVYGIINEHNGR